MSTSAAVPVKAPAPQVVESQILGVLKVSMEECFEFPNGIFGFPASKRWVLVPAERRSFFWLQSLDCPSLAFLLVDPFAVTQDFYVDLPEGDLLPLKASHSSDIGVLAIITLPRDPGDAPSANLQGLVALNFTKRVGRQVIIQDCRYGTRWPVNLQNLDATS